MDEGYLLRSGCDVLGVGHRHRQPSPSVLVRWMSSLASTGRLTDAYSDCARVYWYDAAFETTDPRHHAQQRTFRAIASEERIQLRLGHLRESAPGWQAVLERAIDELNIDRVSFEQRFPIRPVLRQKGVDTLMAIDLVRLAERGAMGSALVLAGDSDIAEAIRIARDAGVLITVVTPTTASVSLTLRELADRVTVIPHGALAEMLPARKDHPATTNRRSPAPGRPQLISHAGAARRPDHEPPAPGDTGSLTGYMVSTTDSSGVRYVPFVEADRVGYIAQGPTGTTRIYLSPSRHDGSDQATVVVCIGGHGDPALDAAQDFYRPFGPAGTERLSPS